MRTTAGTRRVAPSSSRTVCSTRFVIVPSACHQVGQPSPSRPRRTTGEATGLALGGRGPTSSGSGSSGWVTRGGPSAWLSGPERLSPDSGWVGNESVRERRVVRDSATWCTPGAPGCGAGARFVGTRFHGHTANPQITSAPSRNPALRGRIQRIVIRTAFVVSTALSAIVVTSPWIQRSTPNKLGLGGSATRPLLHTPRCS